MSLAVLFISLMSCQRPDKTDLTGSLPVWWNRLANQYARGFTLGYYNELKIIEVHEPWQGEKHAGLVYILAPKGYPVSDSLHEYGQIIRIPVDRVICTSTTHIAFLEALGQTSRIVGVSGVDLITNETIRKGIREGTISDIGYDRNLNFEILIASHPGLVVTYGIENEIAGFVNRLEQLNIPAVLNGEYLEEGPLGKLEWIRFMAAFFNLEERANTWFDSIRHQYEKLVDITTGIDERPVVMTGFPWKDIWYVSGANSTIATLIQDAGGNYLWSELQSDRAVPMDLETVFETSAKAAIWIHPGTASSIADIIQTDERFGHFIPIRNRLVYNNNARQNATGGNDFWESGIIYPDRVLKDLIYIIHPQLIDGHRLYYYTKLD